MDKSKFVPIYCVIPEQWELPELVDYESHHDFLIACEEKQREGKLGIKLRTELLWRNRTIAEQWVTNINTRNPPSKVGRFWISENTASDNMVQTTIVLMRTHHPIPKECPLMEGELELVAVSNFLGLHELTSTPFFLNFETCYEKLGVIAIPIHKFFEDYRILEL